MGSEVRILSPRPFSLAKSDKVGACGSSGAGIFNRLHDDLPAKVQLHSTQWREGHHLPWLLVSNN